MLTYQDLQAVPDDDKAMADFAQKVIAEHKSSELYKTAVIADDYDRCQNTTITQYQKTLRTVEGRQIPDQWSPNHKCASNFFSLFMTQENQYLLANGVRWKEESTGQKLGADFDTRLQQAGKAALCGGVSFGFFNLDHLEVFKVTEFAPLYDEENGALAAGVRFWQIDATKPLRATLYEMDGYTNYLWQKDQTKMPESAKWSHVSDDCYMRRKVPYKVTVKESEADGARIYAGENYPAFPIVPLWANAHHQSEIVGMREKIDAYDLILNGFENDLDTAQIYWVIKGAGGMDDVDLTQFLDRLRTVRAAAPAEGQEVTPVEVSIPYDARERLLERLESRLYKDSMILNPAEISGGAATATQIRAAYEPQNVKTDQFEYCVIEFLQGILRVAGIEDEPTFTRSAVINVQEEVQTVLQAATYLSRDYVTRKVLTLLGDGDRAEEVLEMLDAEDAERMAGGADV